MKQFIDELPLATSRFDTLTINLNYPIMMNKTFYILLVLFIPFLYSCEKGESNTVNIKEPYDKNITAIAVHNNVVWVGTSRNGLYKFDGELWTSYSDKDGMLSDTISSLVVSANGCLWVGTNMGVSKFENGNWTNLTTAEGLYNNNIYSLACDQQNNIWIGTRENKLQKYNGTNFNTYSISTQLAPEGFGHIHTITCDLEGNVWVGSCSTGLSKFDGTTWIHNIENLNVFVSSSMCIANGNVWIGHYTGAYLLSSGVWTNYTTNNGLIDNYVQCFTIDKQMNIWIGTYAGLSKFDGTSWTSYTTSNGLLDNYISSLACDNNGDIWVGSTNGGLLKLTTTK